MGQVMLVFISIGGMICENNETLQLPMWSGVTLCGFISNYSEISYASPL